MTFQIIPVESKKDLKRFIDLPYELYRNDVNWVPPIKKMEYEKLDRKKNPFYEHSNMKKFIAVEKGKVMGRIAGIIDDNYIEFHQTRTGYFGFFECFDSHEIAKGLFEECENFLVEHGMENVIGPMNYSTNEECGLLFEGYDSPPVFLLTYNPPYYNDLVAKCGYKKAKDLLAFHAKVTKELPEKVKRVVERVRENNNIIIRHFDKKNFESEFEKVKQVYNNAWSKNWGFVPMTEEEIDHMGNNLRPLLVPELILFAETEGKTVGFMWSMPDYNFIIKKMKGRFNPLLYILNKNKMKWVRVVTLGIIEGYRRQGIDAVFFADAVENAAKLGFTDAEFSWVLEDNYLVHRVAEKMGASVYKKYRIYEKDLSC